MQAREFVEKYGITATAASRPGFYEHGKRQAAWWCTLSRSCDNDRITFEWFGPIGARPPSAADLVATMAKEAVYGSGTLDDWLRADGLKATLAHRNRWQQWIRNCSDLEKWTSGPDMWADLLSVHPANS